LVAYPRAYLFGQKRALTTGRFRVIHQRYSLAMPHSTVVGRKLKLVARLALYGVLVLGALTCLALSLHLMYEAGCTGDPKGGVLGDIPRALELENGAAGFGWGGVLLAGFVAALILRVTASRRVLSAVAVTVLSFVFVTYFGMNAEARGVQACLIRK
jgi:FtsH-binding integral membrane protein